MHNHGQLWLYIPESTAEHFFLIAGADFLAILDAGLYFYLERILDFSFYTEVLQVFRACLGEFQYVR